MWQNEAPAPALENGEMASGQLHCEDALESDREMRLALVGAMREQNEMIGALDEDLCRIVEHANADSAVQSCSLATVSHLYKLIAMCEEKQEEREQRMRDDERRRDEEFQMRIEQVVTEFESKTARTEKRMEEINSVCEKMMDQHSKDLNDLERIDRATIEHSQSIRTIHEKLDNFSDELYVGTDQVIVDEDGDVSLTQTLENLSEEYRTMKRGLDVQRRTSATQANVLETKASRDVEALASKNEQSIAQLQQFVQDNVDVDLMDVRRKQDQLLAAVEDYQADLDTRPTDESVDQKIAKKYDSMLSQLHRALASVKDDDTHYKDCIETLQTKTVEIQRQTIADFKASTTHIRALEERIRDLEATLYAANTRPNQSLSTRTASGPNEVKAAVNRPQPQQRDKSASMKPTPPTANTSVSATLIHQQPATSTAPLPINEPSNAAAVSIAANRRPAIPTTNTAIVTSDVNQPSEEPNKRLKKQEPNDAAAASAPALAKQRPYETSSKKMPPATSTALEETVSRKQQSLPAREITEDPQEHPALVESHQPTVRDELLDKRPPKRQEPRATRRQYVDDGVDQQSPIVHESRVLEEHQEAQQREPRQIVFVESKQSIREACVTRPPSAQQNDAELVDTVDVPEERAPSQKQQQQLAGDQGSTTNTFALPVASLEAELSPSSRELPKQRLPKYEPETFLSLLSEKLDKAAAEAMIASAVSRLSVSVKAHIDRLLTEQQQQQQRKMPPLKRQHKPLPSIKQRQAPGSQPIKIPAPEPDVSEEEVERELREEGAKLFSFSVDDLQSSWEKIRPETEPASPEQQHRRRRENIEREEEFESRDYPRRVGVPQSPAARNEERRGGEEENVVLLSNRFRCLSCKAPYDRLLPTSSSLQEENGVGRRLGAGFKARDSRTLGSKGSVCG